MRFECCVCVFVYLSARASVSECTLLSQARYEWNKTESTNWAAGLAQSIFSYRPPIDEWNVEWERTPKGVDHSSINCYCVRHFDFGGRTNDGGRLVIEGFFACSRYLCEWLSKFQRKSTHSNLYFIAVCYCAGPNKNNYNQLCYFVRHNFHFVSK